MRRDPKKKLIYPPPDSYLRACKPTEGQAWVHVLCSVFIPEITYSDASKLRLVEGISAIPVYRWQNVSNSFAFAASVSRLHCSLMPSRVELLSLRPRRRCRHTV